MIEDAMQAEWDAAVTRVQGLPLSVTATQVTGIIYDWMDSQ